MADLAEKKQRIRNEMLARRRRLSVSETESAGAALRGILDGYMKTLADRPVLAYVESGREIPLSPWIKCRLENGGGVYLPRVRGDRSHPDMDFYYTEHMDLLTAGAYGILEPDPSVCGKYVPDPDQPPVVLVPGVAFDREGNRLGHGAGYYDRYLEKISECRKIGVCYDWQVLDAVPAEATDIKMNDILTDGGIIHVQ